MQILIFYLGQGSFGKIHSFLCFLFFLESELFGKDDFSSSFEPKFTEAVPRDVFVQMFFILQNWF